MTGMRGPPYGQVTCPYGQVACAICQAACVLCHTRRGDNDDAMALAALLLAAGSTLVGGLPAGVTARGFGDLRPAHGFAFARLAPSGATVSELADHLGVTRQ